MNLADTSLLLTRTLSASLRFSDALHAEARFSRVVISPVFEIVALRAIIDDDPRLTFIFTSEQGVPSAALQSPPSGRRALCVGPRTAAVAKTAGYVAQALGGTADGLVDAILEDPPEGPLLHVRGRHGRGEVAARLHEAGLDAREVVAYDQRAKPLSDEALALLQNPGRIILPVFSPRSAELLADQVEDPKARLMVAAISDAAAAPMSRIAHGRVEVAPTPDAQGLLGVVNRLLASPSLA